MGWDIKHIYLDEGPCVHAQRAVKSINLGAKNTCNVQTYSAVGYPLFPPI